MKDYKDTPTHYLDGNFWGIVAVCIVIVHGIVWYLLENGSI